MNGIKMSDCKFYVDEVARTVICVIPETKSMIEDYIGEHFMFTDVDLSAYWGSKFRKAMKMPRSFTGKAVCSKDDEWNEKLGRMIAFSRAKDKCYKSFFKRANLFVQTVDRRLSDVISTFNDFGIKLDVKKSYFDEKIEEMMQK